MTQIRHKVTFIGDPTVIENSNKDDITLNTLTCTAY